MHRFIKLFDMYTGLKKEIYILAFGKVVTSMGSLIWPMMTLILKSKLGMSADLIGFYMMIMSFIMIPCNLLGGKLADRFNKKMMIVFFDFISVICFFLAGCKEISMLTVIIYAIGSIFQQMEGPSYDSLVADLTTYKDREKAYSLNYLAMNLGLVLAPMIGGLLFNSYLWLAFFISAFSVLLSTILIFFFVKDLKISDTSIQNNVYEKDEKGSIFTILNKRKSILIYFLLCSISGIIYSQFNFLIPLHLESIFSENGAFLFGVLTSINAAVVILATPLLTKWFANCLDLHRMLLGNVLEICSLATYIFIQNQFYICCISMVFFTFGEILCTISSTPYLTKRIPSTHRGRIISIQNITASILSSIGNTGIGMLIVMFSFSKVWMFIAFLGAILIAGIIVYLKIDRKKYPLLYKSTE